MAGRIATTSSPLSSSAATLATAASAHLPLQSLPPSWWWWSSSPDSRRRRRRRPAWRAQTRRTWPTWRRHMRPHRVAAVFALSEPSPSRVRSLIQVIALVLALLGPASRTKASQPSSLPTNNPASLSNDDNNNNILYNIAVAAAAARATA